MTTDQRGAGFARTENGKVDIGAYELQSQTSGALDPQADGAAPMTLRATSFDGSSVSFAVKSGPATPAGENLTITGVGRVVTAASQAGNAFVPAATTLEQTFTFSPGTPSNGAQVSASGGVLLAGGVSSSGNAQSAATGVPVATGDPLANLAASPVTSLHNLSMIVADETITGNGADQMIDGE